MRNSLSKNKCLYTTRTYFCMHDFVINLKCYEILLTETSVKISDLAFL